MEEKLLGIGKSYRNKLSKVLEKNNLIIKPSQVAEILNISKQEAGRILSRWNKNGWIKRVNRGIYIPIPINSTTSSVISEEPMILVDTIFKPGYIAGFSAVKNWDFSEQIIETITYFTSKKVMKRNPVYNGIKCKIKTVSIGKMFGLKNIWIENQSIKVSDPTKTIIDIVDDPKIVGGITLFLDIFNQYVESEYFDLDLVMEYASKMNNRTIYKRLGFLFDTVIKVNEKYKNICYQNISKGYSVFDNATPSLFFVNKWKLKTSKYWKEKYDSKN